MTDLLQFLIDNAPQAGSGGIFTLLVVYVLSKSSKIPLSIQWGNPGRKTQYLTTSDLEANCNKRQSHLDKSLIDIKSGHTVIIEKLETLKDNVAEKLSDHGERIASIEGHLRIRRATDRKAA